MKQLLLGLAIISILFSHAGWAASPEQLKENLSGMALEAIDCARFLGGNQCNSLQRCMETKTLLKQVGDGKAPLLSVSNYTAASDMNCCCVQAFVGHNFIKSVLDNTGALPHDLRYQSCYGRC